ncbi:MAG: hypothetical protein K0S00_2106 [Xanthobacteraceae bacterium]|nr:hypothetical protein [Xanthobacteraceae bacterium]
MAEVTNELIYEVLKAIQRDVAETRHSVSEVKVELNAMRGHLIAMQQDIHNIYATLTRHEVRLDRIERRLELTESPFAP